MNLTTFTAVCSLICQGRISVRPAMALIAIHGNPDLNMSQITSLTKCSTAAVTGIMDRLEKEGFLKREHSMTDRRKVTCCLTSKGTAFVQNIINAEESK